MQSSDEPKTKEVKDYQKETFDIIMQYFSKCFPYLFQGDTKVFKELRLNIDKLVKEMSSSISKKVKAQGGDSVFIKNMFEMYTNTYITGISKANKLISEHAMWKSKLSAVGGPQVQKLIVILDNLKKNASNLSFLKFDEIAEVHRVFEFLMGHFQDNAGMYPQYVNTEVKVNSKQGRKVSPVAAGMGELGYSTMLSPANVQMISPASGPIRSPANAQIRSPANVQMISPVNQQMMGMPMIPQANMQMISPSSNPIRSPANTQIRSPANTQIRSPAPSQKISPGSSSQTRSPAKSQTTQQAAPQAQPSTKPPSMYMREESIKKIFTLVRNDCAVFYNTPRPTPF